LDIQVEQSEEGDDVQVEFPEEGTLLLLAKGRKVVLRVLTRFLGVDVDGGLLYDRLREFIAGLWLHDDGERGEQRAGNSKDLEGIIKKEGGVRSLFQSSFGSLGWV